MKARRITEPPVDARTQIASFMRRLYERGLTTTSGGNLSIREGSVVYLTPSASDKGRMEPEDVGATDLDGNIVGKGFKPSIETRMHLEVYKARPDISAIVHAHPANASAFAASDAPIRSDLLSESYAILGRIAVAPYHCMGTPELALSVAEAIKGANCVIMRNHGALAVGRSMLEAFDRLEVLEAAAKVSLAFLGPLKGHALPLSAADLAAIDSLMGRS